ncbi:hypothetical protein [Mycolicibacterium vaccae]|uniref:hypothetical protein n=1 Tax=Mycolicibacterium vaccae TaxID=1810 RepID=UPI001181A48D|nr:hypothetical protein [Mycolicibacterium vaccae]
MSDLQGNPLSDALARLDADIAATEERLKRLREMRDSIPQFVEQYVSSPLEISDVESLSKNRDDETETSGSYTSLVFNVLKESPNTALDVGDVQERLRSQGWKDISQGTARNALYYLVRTRRLQKGTRRGTFVFKDRSSVPEALES